MHTIFGPDFKLVQMLRDIISKINCNGIKSILSEKSSSA